MAKNRILSILAALILLLSAAPAASAAQTGSLRISGIDHSVKLYRVADSTASLTPDFSGAAVKELQNEKNAAANARILAAYVKSKNISGESLTPGAEKEVLYRGLEEGMYLACSQAAQSEFAPFLVSIPTQIGGKTVYHIHAEPKQEEPTPTTQPGTTRPSSGGGNIPQTGGNLYLKYILLAVGGALILLGFCDLIRGKEDAYE